MPFIDTPLERKLALVDLNVRSVVHLAKHVVQEMAPRGQGRILFASSVASTMPGPYQAVCNASKSFVQSFALALREELADTGITVTRAHARPGRHELLPARRPARHEGRTGPEGPPGRRRA